MANHVALVAGLMVGISIAVPIGPMGLLCIQRTLASGMQVGVCTGLGAATVNIIYGAFVILGLESLGPLVATGGRALSFVGGLFLLWSAARTLHSKHHLLNEVSTQRLSPLMAYGSAVVFNITNPMSPLLIVALLSPIVEPSSLPWRESALLLLGMFVAATSWWICLSGSIALLRSHLTPEWLTRMNQIAGALLTVYGALALARSAGL